MLLLIIQYTLTLGTFVAFLERWHAFYYGIRESSLWSLGFVGVWLTMHLYILIDILNGF